MSIAIFIDLDNTLVKTEIAYDQEELSGSGWTPYSDSRVYQGEVAFYRSQLRPYAEEFLLELGSSFPLYLLTSGDRYFQTNILQQHHIDNYFIGIFGNQDITQAINKRIALVPSSTPLLVDDLPPGSIGFNSKFSAIGILPHELGDWSQLSYADKRTLLELFVKKYYVEVPYYNGKIGDQGLLKIFPEILEKANKLLLIDK